VLPRPSLAQMMTANSRKRVPTRSPPAAARARVDGRRGMEDELVHLHRLSGRETLGTSFVEVVAVLGIRVSVILPSLMIG